MPLILGIIVGLLLLVWGGVEAARVVSEYPAESIFAVSSLFAITAAVTVARFRAAGRRVSLDPATRGTVITAAPVRPSVMPAPAAPPSPPIPLPPVPVLRFPERPPDRCDGPQCKETLDDDPWNCEGVMPDGHTVKGRFHSKGCLEAWQRLMTERHAAPATR